MGVSEAGYMSPGARAKRPSGDHTRSSSTARNLWVTGETELTEPVPQGAPGMCAEDLRVTWAVVGVLALVGVDIVAGATGPDASSARLAGAMAALVAIAVTLLLHLRMSRPWWTLAALTALTYVPLAALGAVWLPVGGALAGASVTLRSAAAGRAAAVAVLVAQVVLAWALTGSGPRTAVTAVATLAVAIALACTFGLDHLLARQRSEAATSAISATRQERRRFARDLHDLLGRQLSLVILEGELARRAVRLRPEETRRRLTTLLDAARQSLTDVRAVARAYRRPSLDAELTSARQVLEAAGVRCEIRLDADEPPGEDAAPLGPVLFEAITNVLRHAQARTCLIVVEAEAGWYRMTITNDGADEATGTGGGGGTGLAGAREHVTTAGGTLHAAAEPPGSFRLTAEIPRRSPGA